LHTVPGFLRELPFTQRRRVLLADLLAGMVATMIGLGTVTGTELIGGKALSCMVWSCSEDSSSEESPSSPGLSIFGGRSYWPTTNTPSARSGEQPVGPGNEQQVPRQPNRQPTGAGAGGGAGQPDGTPQVANPSQPGDEPGTKEAAPPVKGSEKGRGVILENGKEKEDRY